MVLPLVFMVTGSLRPPGQPPSRTPELLPQNATVASYDLAFETVDLARQIVNSLIVAGIAVPLTVIVASSAGFAMTRLSRRVATLLQAASLLALMVPATALLVGRFTIFRTLHLTNTFVPLVAPALIAMSPFYVLLYYWSFRRLPGELFDAARLEGMGLTGMWFRVAMPLVRPITVAVAVLAFVLTWNDFLDPLIYLSDADRFTLPLGLRLLAQLDRSNQPVFLAGAVVATLPVVGAFLYVQRFFLGESRGAGWLGR